MRIFLAGKNKDKIVELDKQDYVKYKDNNLRMDSNGYIIIYIDKKSQKLHRLIMNAPKELQVDHKNSFKWDCRRSNLRLCTTSQNNANRLRGKNNSSGYKGVYKPKKLKKWYAQIKFGTKTLYLGAFQRKQDAAAAYLKKAKELYGEFARL